MTEFIGDGVRAELVLRELGEAVLWLKSITQGINNMDTAMRAVNGVVVERLSRTNRLLDDINDTLLRIEENTVKKPRRKTKRRK